MRVPLSWLRELSHLDVAASDRAGVESLASTMADLGLVPEAIDYVDAALDGVVVARIQEISAIPGADRIRRVLVDSGRETQVVCGAWNFEVGDLVPLARPGTLLPGAQEPLARRRMRGVESDGMLCSPAELGLGEDQGGILILDSRGLEVGQALSDMEGMGPDVVFDLEVQANRPDCLSIAGVVRDICARLSVELRLDELPLASPPPETGRGSAGELVSLAGASLSVEAPELCPRILATVLEGVRVRPSQPLVARRLSLCGMRPLNNVVDASNYVMLELGQPTHPYDLDALGSAGLLVRRARGNEKLTTLDGTVRSLSEEDCVIADASGEAVGVAGVMGGASSEIGEGTTRVLLEAAYFHAAAIASTARRMGLRTEASARFEKGCDPFALERATARIRWLLSDAIAGRAASLLEEGTLPRQEPVSLRLSRLNGLLGTSLSLQEVVSLLEPMGFSCSERSGELLSVEVPSWRPDTSREVDVIEEAARQFGYSRIGVRRRRPLQVGLLDHVQIQRRQVRWLCSSLGATEAWTPTLLAPSDHERCGLEPTSVEVENPLSADESVLRADLLPGLLSALRRNAGRGFADVALFEVGRVFEGPFGSDGLPRERELMGLLLARLDEGAFAAVQAWRSLADLLRLLPVRIENGPVPGMHPGRSARLVDSGGSLLGHVGEIDPEVSDRFDLAGRRIGWLEVDLDALGDSPRRPEVVVVPSRFPSAQFDLAFVVPEEVPAADVEDTLRRAGGDLLVGMELFDVFRGESLGAGRRSLAWHLSFAAQDRTLGDEELARLREDCTSTVHSAHGAALRS